MASATDYLLQNVNKRLRKRYRSKYFVCCSSCGSTEWLDFEDDMGDIRTIPNELTSKGEMLVPKKLIEYLITRKKEQGFGLMCMDCEKELEPILFCDVDRQMRIKVFNMTNKERKNFANGYAITEKLRRENDFKEEEKSKK